MVSAALDAPGIRLTAAELLALREGVPRTGRHRPASRRPGALPAKAAGAGMDLREIRAFAEGDDARRIDPAATARTGLPHIRSFHEDRDDTLLLIADFRPSMLWGTGETLRSVRAARALARRGWQAVARGASLAAISVDAAGVAVIPLGGGVPQMSRISHMLAGRHDQALDARGEAPPSPRRSPVPCGSPRRAPMCSSPPMRRAWRPTTSRRWRGSRGAAAGAARPAARSAGHRTAHAGAARPCGPAQPAGPAAPVRPRRAGAAPAGAECEPGDGGR